MDAHHGVRRLRDLQVTPLVKKPGFGLSCADLPCVHLFIADPDLARICVHTIVAGFYSKIP